MEHTTPGTTALAATLLALCLPMTAGASEALTPQTTADSDPPSTKAVENRLFANAGNFEVAAAYAIAPVAQMIRRQEVHLGFGWNPTETLSIHLRGTLGLHSHTSAFADASDAIQTSDPALRFRIADDFKNAWLMNWSADATLRWMPIYGKLSLFSAATLRLGAFARVSAGIGGFSRQSAIDVRLDEQGQLKPIFGAGLGLRFYACRHLSFDLAADARMFPDTYPIDVDRTAPETSGEEASGLTFAAFISLAAVFAF